MYTSLVHIVFSLLFIQTEAFLPTLRIQLHDSLSFSTPSRCKSTSKENDIPQSTISPTDPKHIFPVISQIAGIEWTGSCRYINGQLTPMSTLKLTGGVKYDVNGTTLTLSSYLTFPNGNTREVVMKGERTAFPPTHEVMTLEPVEEGPIIMKLSEVYPDTILINEVERATGKIIMTSSVSIVQGLNGVEIVGVSHEVGDEMKNAIEGHQIWRMTALSPIIEYNDKFKDTTGDNW